MVWDCRGDSVAEAVARAGDYRGLSALARHWAGSRAEMQRRVAARTCDAAIFVGQLLADLCAHHIGPKPKLIIHCTASEDRFFYDPEARQAQRRRLGYQVDDKVLVYCGSLTSFEYFEDSLEYFARSAESDPRLRFLAVTPQVEVARRLVSRLKLPGVIVVQAEFEEVNLYLNAADAGLLLRRRDAIGAVASPTKFAEYCLTGLPVIMNDYIGDTFSVAQSLGLCVSPDAMPFCSRLSGEQRAAAAKKACVLLGKAQHVFQYEQLYNSAFRRGECTTTDEFCSVTLDGARTAR